MFLLLNVYLQLKTLRMKLLGQMENMYTVLIVNDKFPFLKKVVSTTENWKHGVGVGERVEGENGGRKGSGKNM